MTIQSSTRFRFRVRTLALAVAGGMAALGATGPGLAARQAVPPLVSFGWDYLPYSPITNPGPSPAEQNLETVVNNPRIEVNLPLRLGGGVALVNTVRYGQVAFGYRNTLVLPAGAPDALHDLSYRATLSVPVSERWRVATTAQLGLHSDFENVESDHLRFQGAMVANRRFGSASSIGLGAAYINDFGEPKLLPVLNLRAAAGNLRLDLQAPRRAAGFVRITDGFEIGAQAAVDGGYYRLGGAPGEGDRVKYSVLSLGPAMNIDVTGSATLKVTTGAALSRRFEVQDDTASELRDIDLDDGFFVRFGLEIRPSGVSASGADR